MMNMKKGNTTKDYVAINRSTLIILAIVAVLGGGAIIFYNYYPSGSGGGVGGEGGVPKIQVMPSSYNFGDIPSKAVNHTFVVKNIGTSPLEIRRVSTSCGCTSAEISKETIFPNQEANLFVKFDPNLMEEKVEGEVLRIVYIKSNDPEQPEIEVELRANVMA